MKTVTVSIAFWNLKRKELGDLVAKLICALESDIFVLLEHTGTDVTRLKQSLGQNYYELEDPALYAVNTPSLIPARVFARRSLINFVPVKAVSHRFIAATLVVTGISRKLLLVALHLPDKSRNTESEQATASVEFAREISCLEEQTGCANTIVIGDFNMNPFEPGMVNREAFNAVATRREARRITRNKNRKLYKMFFNPCWHLFSDYSGMPPGTYYYSSGSIRWNVLDQVLLRPSLIEALEIGTLRVVNSIDGTDLHTAEGLPDDNEASDHFPVTFNLKLDEEEKP